MKKLLRIIPLMVMPLLLSSCNIFSFNSLSKDESSETQSSDNTSQSSSDNNVSSEDSSETSSSSSSEETPVGPVLPTSITISGPTEVSIGETIQLSALVLPENATNKTVTWSHTSVTGTNYAAINSTTGEVTGKKAGNVTVTAKSVADNTVKATYTIAVKDILPTSISVSGADQVMVGSTIKLTATILPENATKKSVTWTSSNTTIASVSSGTVTGKKAGTVTITAKCTSAPTVTTTKTITVVAPTPTNVTLNQTEITIGYTKTYQLSATVTPSNADQTVSWSSNNTSVATVSSSGLVTAKSVTGNATITATTTNGLTATCLVHVEETVLDKWTILIYMCGSDLESGYDSNNDTTNVNEAGYASADIDEILQVNGQPSDVNIVIETGGARAWKNSKIDADKLGRWHVEGKQIVSDAQLTYASMGESTTLSSFLTWGMQTYPAQKTGVIFWNHGGAMQGVCQDETETGGWDMLTNSEVKTALTTTFNDLGRTEKLEFVGYDACLMQVQDVAEFNSQFFNYMVGSEESEAGFGWEYNTWINYVYQDKPTTTILQRIADRFVNYYDEYYNHQYANDQTLSYLDLSKMAAYKSAFETLASKIGTCINNYGKTNFQDYLKTHVKYFSATQYTTEELQETADYYGVSVSYVASAYGLTYVDGSYWDFSAANRFGVFDVKDFLAKIKGLSQFSSISSYITAAENARDDLVAYSTCGGEAGESYGLTLFFPLSSNAYRTHVYTANETNFTNWRSVVNTYGV